MEDKKIIIADDETETLEILARKLQEKGFTVFSAPTANACLEIAKKELPDLIILDIVMPDMNGYQICSTLKDNPETKNIKIIFTTGQDLEPKAILKHCEELNAVDFLLKPFTLEDLFKKIEEVFTKGGANEIR